MANDFDKEPDGDRERQKKREREREEVEKAARDLADDIRSSSLISNHDPKIAVSVGGWVDGDAAQYNSTRTNPEDRVHGWRGVGRGDSRGNDALSH
jgi:hypothetical protein